MSENNPKIYKVKVNEFEFQFTQEEVERQDMLKQSASQYNLLKNHKSYNAVLLNSDGLSKNQVIEIEGEHFETRIQDELDQMLDKMGFSTVANKQIKEIKAPMPGLVLEVSVSEGDQVNDGDKILILVAMKMENSIMVNTTATIKRIAVSAGQAVEKGQVLIELD